MIFFFYEESSEASKTFLVSFLFWWERSMLRSIRYVLGEFYRITASIFVLLVRLCYQSFFNLKSCWQFYSLWIGVFSIFVGSFGGLKQRRLKTLLAYSSTSHMGYALIAFSTNTFVGIQMLLFYMFIYMVSGLAVWYIIVRIK